MNKLQFFTLNALAQLEAYAKGAKLYHNTNSDLIYAQAKLESGNFKSAIFIENNNIFGLKHPVKRPTTSIGTSRGHAKYRTIYDCLVDYYLRQNYFKVEDTADVDKYLKELHRTKYAEDLQYLAKIKKIYLQDIAKTV